MTEVEARKLNAQVREFPETMEILSRIRAALADRMFKTTVGDSAEREAIYLRVQAFDAMQEEMKTILNRAKDEKAIEEYAASFATTGK